MTINDRVEIIINRDYGGNKAAFANVIGVHPAILSNYIGKQRRSKVSVEMVVKIIKATGCDPMWLMTGQETAPAVTHGDHSPAVTGSGNVVTTGGGDSATEAALRERVRLLEELVAEKERTIGLLMRGGK